MPPAVTSREVLQIREQRIVALKIKLTQELLLAFWPVSRQDQSVIRAYNVDKPDTWKPARRAWDKYLKRQ